MDISDFYQTFFDEADELLADMEQHLLVLQPEAPDAEQLNAIFRAAHSIKGGAGNSRKSRMLPASIISARPCVNWH